MFQSPDVFEANSADKQTGANRYLVRALFARIDPVAMAIATGATFAVGLFLATAILLVKGAPPGVPIGGNLSALGIFLPGYQVSWWGVALGSFYGFVIGFVVGVFVSLFWNFAHIIFIGVAVLRGSWLD